LYAAFLVAVTWLVRDRLAALALLGGVALGGAVLVVYLTANLLGGNQGLFIERRIADPIGYTNGLGSYLLTAAFWPAVAVAERARPLAVSALGAGTASLAASLMLLTQSRGVAAALVLSVVVVLALVPGRLPRAWLLILLAAGLAVAAPTLLDVYSSTLLRRPTPSSIRSAGEVALLIAVVVSLVWGGALAAVRTMGDGAGPALRKVGLGGIAALVVAAIAAAVVFSGRIADEARTQYDAFVHPRTIATVSTVSRLSSGSGNRYDLWRVALDDFTGDPLKGVGAGNWPASWFQHRVVVQDVQQPHSLELEALSELGIVGGLLVLLFAGGVYVGLAGRRVVTRSGPTARMLTVAAAGAFTAWFVHTSVDWLQLMPGLTGIALAGAAVLTGDEAGGARRRLVSWPVLVAAVAVVAVGAAFLVRQTLADAYNISGRHDRAPRAAIADANRALAYDDDLLDAYYLKAAAYAQLGDDLSSRATLLAATRREPHDWVTWALLGDLAVRARDFRGARLAYGHAFALNPRSGNLRHLAANPRHAVRLAR
jgi:O-antigen ligase